MREQSSQHLGPCDAAIVVFSSTGRTVFQTKTHLDMSPSLETSSRLVQASADYSRTFTAVELTLPKGKEGDVVHTFYSADPQDLRAIGDAFLAAAIEMDTALHNAGASK